MNINEIFSSIDGESKRAGELATFVRSAGCNLRCGWCFGPNQANKYPEVILADMTKKSIAELRIGDEILTLDDKKEIVITTVTQVLAHITDEYEKLTFNNTSLIVTPEHPFFCNNQWKNASDLIVGDEVTYIPDYKYALYQVISTENLKMLLDYTIQVFNDSIKQIGNNAGVKNGNYNPDYAFHNLSILKRAIKKGICTQDILTGTHCDTLVVHHLDENPQNDDLSNMVIISRKLHDELHARGYHFKKRPQVDYVTVLSHTKSYGENYSRQLGKKLKQVIGISCAPYNTYLIDNIYVHNCDSKYTWGTEDTNKQMTIPEIVEECKKLGNHNITFTGGEPLLQKDSDELIVALARAGFDVGIETNGAIDFTTRDWFINNNPSVWVCADFKCPTSGQTDKMLPIKAFSKLRPQDVLKFVVGSHEDLKNALYVMTALRENGCDCYFYISPVFGMIEYKDIIQFMKDNKLQHKIRFQLQIHKFV